MDERISIITHQGQAIMLIDFRHCSAQEMLLILEEARRRIANYPKNSLLTLGDFTDAHVDRAVATRMKEVLVMDRPFVKRSAWVGSESLPHVYLESFKTFTQRHFAHFKTREEAMDWLVQDDSPEQ